MAQADTINLNAWGVGYLSDRGKDGIPDVRVTSVVQILNAKLTEGGNTFEKEDRGIVEFNLSSITDNIVSATLVLVISNPTTSSNVFDLELHAYEGDGSIRLADWDGGNHFSTFSFDTAGSPGDPTLSLDVTSFVQGLVGNFAGFRLEKPIVSAPFAGFFGRSGEPQNLPLLILETSATIATAIADVEDLIAETAAPDAALKDLGKAIDKLNKAQDKLDEDDTEKALGELAKAAKELEHAGAWGADVNDILTALLGFARSLAEDAADAARPLAGINYRVDGFLAAMEAKLVEAEVEAAFGTVEKAIKAFKDVVKNASDAVAAVPHGELEDTSEGVIDLITDPETPAAAQPDLLKAIAKLEKAQEKLDNGDTAKGIKDMAGAAKELEKAAEDGAATAGFVESLVDLAWRLANEAATEARRLAGTNAEVDEKLAKMEAKLVKAEGKAAAGDFDKAIKEFSGAVKEADKAFDAAAERN